MTKFISALVVVAAVAGFAIAGIAQSSVSSAQYGGEDRLFGGGRFVYDFDPGPGELVLPRDIGIFATARDGRGVTGSRVYGNPDAAQPGSLSEISCVAVEGARAVVGFVDNQGTQYVEYFEDNGRPGPDPPDLITPALGLSAEDAAQFMPKQFPRVCPSVTPPAEWGAVWTTLDAGDIAVVDG